MSTKLRKIREGKWLGGICGGVAYRFGLPVWIVRVVWCFLFLTMGAGILLYMLLWMFMPWWEKTPEDFNKVTGD